MRPLLALAAVASLAWPTAGCANDRSLPADASYVEVKVMSRNVYVGADVDQVLSAQTPEEMFARVEEVWQMVLAADFNERAEVLADEIAAARPHLAGLQEISLLRTQSPGDAIVGGTVPAEDVAFDFLEILMGELAERGLDYRAAAQVRDSDVEIPRGNATFDDVRLTDFDVILARGDVEIADVVAQNFTARRVVPTPAGIQIEILRGWVAVDATIDGETFRFINTHLEPAESNHLVQAAQAAELIQILSVEYRPIILVGDLNTTADGSGTATYETLLNEGYVDVWLRDATPDGAGATCCHTVDLRNSVSLLDRRLDYVLLRNVAPLSVEAWVVGDEPSDRTGSGMWPSDHGGVVVRIFVSKSSVEHSP
ncbi:MAG: endonuclease [Gemmatimonadales bacterium]|nr:endonuclease [Gemmatimonadales bacterium]NIN12929.1 endonuclease [Gemmatimonadales bacterium]NIR02217.1 endonuclease [Gemmatimonadales bacterium]NIS66009.1 endonuclease [Gemmatimonadales bacterium]